MEIDMPKYVDSQVQILWWEADEFVVAMTIFSTGMMLHMLVLPVIAMVVVGRVLQKMKRVALEGEAMHTLCATGLISINDEFDDALEKEFYA